MDQEKTYKWIQDRIHDLHAGILSAEDRIRMDELAKTDPFVRDAMEGYQSNPEYDHSVLLKVIANRIQHKQSSRRPKILPLSKGWVIPAVAASLVLILATWVVMFYIEKQNSNEFLAASPERTTPMEHTTEVQLSEADSLKDIAADEKMEVSNANNSTTLSTSGAEETNQGRSKATNIDASGQSSSGTKNYMLDNTHYQKETSSYPTTEDDIQREELATGDIKQIERESTGKPSTPSPAPPASAQPSDKADESIASPSMAEGVVKMKTNTKRDEGYYANQLSPDLMSKRVTGKVIDEISGEPIIGAMISIANTNLFEMSDIKGDFDFYIPEPTAEIIVDYTGYFITSAIIQQGEENIVFKLQGGLLIPDYRSDEERINIGLQAKHAYFLKVDTEDFRQYLNSSSIYPLAFTYYPLGKMVKLEFNVTKGQAIEKIKITESSGGKKYEDEAIRLLKIGPVWSCEDGKLPCTREFTIYFK